MPRSRTCFELWSSDCGHQIQFRHTHMLFVIIAVLNSLVALWKLKLFKINVSREIVLYKVYFIIFWCLGLRIPSHVIFDQQAPHTMKYVGERANSRFFDRKDTGFLNDLQKNFELWRPCCCCLTCQREFYQMTSRPRV